MDKVRERGAPLPGNDKENWGNRHNEIWRKIEEGGRRKRRGRKEKEEKRKKRRKEKRICRNWGTCRGRGREGHGDHGDDKLKSSKANEWGKLGWNWMRKNMKKKEDENCRIGKVIAVSEMNEKKRRGTKSSNKRKGGKCQGISRKSSQWCNWDMKRKRRIRKKEKEEKEKGVEI